MQAVVREPAAKGGVERAPEREAPRRALARGAFAGRAGLSLDLGDGAPQTRHPLRPVARRHSVCILWVRSLFLFWTERMGESRPGSVSETLPSAIKLRHYPASFQSIANLRYETSMTELLERAIQS